MYVNTASDIIIEILYDVIKIKGQLKVNYERRKQCKLYKKLKVIK